LLRIRRLGVRLHPGTQVRSNVALAALLVGTSLIFTEELRLGHVRRSLRSSSGVMGAARASGRGGMVRVRCFRVRAEKVGRLRDWMAELSRRRDEVLETFANESVRHEVGYLLETTDGPVLVYVIEAEDLEQAAKAVEENPLPIDLEHRKVMQEVLAEPIRLDPILDLRA
jgi:hypothetical protein